MGKENLVRIIKLVPYNPKWEEKYLKEKSLLLNLLNNELVQIYHIGSTAISGIYSKPIIDILIEVKNISNIDKYNDYMKFLGYIPKGEFGIKDRRFFIKGLYNRTHHIHIFETGNPEILRHLNFRNYMIYHPDEAKRYETLKKHLAIKFKYDIDSYCDNKASYINEVDEKARLWSTATI
ncbi:MAG: GrpB family protein [Clostridium sp.]|uniref:GrpB family protein n=1 Tax=Clostridium sp. TaxID=1506 RepID=UPI003F37D5CE